jgi:hypothetical protein
LDVIPNLPQRVRDLLFVKELEIGKRAFVAAAFRPPAFLS